MNAAEVVKAGRDLSESTLGEWGMILRGFLAAVPIIMVFAVLWWRARRKRDEYKRLLDESDVSAFPN